MPFLKQLVAEEDGAESGGLLDEPGPKDKSQLFSLLQFCKQKQLGVILLLNCAESVCGPADSMQAWQQQAQPKGASSEYKAAHSSGFSSFPVKCVHLRSPNCEQEPASCVEGQSAAQRLQEAAPSAATAPPASC